MRNIAEFYIATRFNSTDPFNKRTTFDAHIIFYFTITLKHFKRFLMYNFTGLNIYNSTTNSRHILKCRHTAINNNYTLYITI